MTERSAILLPSSVLERLPFLREARALFFDFGVQFEDSSPNAKGSTALVVVTDTNLVVASFPESTLAPVIIPHNTIAGITRVGDRIVIRNSLLPEVALSLPKLDTFIVHVVNLQDRQLNRAMRMAATAPVAERSGQFGNEGAGSGEGGREGRGPAQLDSTANSDMDARRSLMAEKALQRAAQVTSRADEASLGVVRLGFASMRSRAPSTELEEGSDASSIQTIEHEVAGSTAASDAVDDDGDDDDDPSHFHGHNSAGAAASWSGALADEDDDLDEGSGTDDEDAAGGETLNRTKTKKDSTIGGGVDDEGNEDTEETRKKKVAGETARRRRRRLKARRAIVGLQTVSVDPSSMHRRLRYFFVRYDRAKLPFADGMIAQHRGSENALLAALVQQYGPEPNRLRWRTHDLIAHQLSVQEQLLAQRARARDELLLLGREHITQGARTEQLKRKKQLLLLAMERGMEDADSVMRILSGDVTCLAEAHFQPANGGRAGQTPQKGESESNREDADMAVVQALQSSRQVTSAYEQVIVKLGSTAYYLTVPVSFWPFLHLQVQIVRGAATVPPIVQLIRASSNESMSCNRQLCGTWITDMVGDVAMSVQQQGRWYFVSSSRFFAQQ